MLQFMYLSVSIAAIAGTFRTIHNVSQVTPVLAELYSPQKPGDISISVSLNPFPKLQTPAG